MQSHIIYQAVMITKVASARSSIACAYVDILANASSIPPMDHCPIFRFFVSELEGIEVRFLLDRCMFMLKAIEVGSVFDEVWKQYDEETLKTKAFVDRRAYMYQVQSHWEIYFRLLLVYRFSADNVKFEEAENVKRAGRLKQF